jgi:hypothetical protein
VLGREIGLWELFAAFSRSNSIVSLRAEGGSNLLHCWRSRAAPTLADMQM